MPRRAPPRTPDDAGRRARSGATNGSRTGPPVRRRTRPPGVEAPAVADRNASIDRVAQELVTEVEQASRPGRLEDEVVDQLLEWRLDRLGRDVQDAGQDLRDEAAPDDRAGPGDGLRLGRAVRQPGKDGVLDSVGDVGLADREAVRPARRRRARRAAPRCAAGSRRFARRPRRPPRAALAGRYRGRAWSRVRCRPWSAGASLTSSAIRWVSNRERQSRRLVPYGTSSVR